MKRSLSRTTMAAKACLLGHAALFAAYVGCGSSSDHAVSTGLDGSTEASNAGPDGAPDDMTVQESGSSGPDSNEPFDASAEATVDAEAGPPSLGMDTDADASTSPPDADAGDAYVDAQDSALDGPDARDSGDAAPGDAGDADAPTDAGNPTLLLLAQDLDAGCYSCAVQHGCLDAGDLCEIFAGQVAEGGPAAGASREQLCLTTLSCLLTGPCPEQGTGVDVCVCGNQALAPDCLLGGPLHDDAGRDCVSQEQAGLETTDVFVEIDNETNTMVGGGIANSIVECIQNNGCCL